MTVRSVVANLRTHGSASAGPNRTPPYYYGM